MQSQPSGPRLRIGLVAWDYPPARSGLAVAAREVAESLVARGHDVRVITLDRAGAAAGSPRVIGAAEHLDAGLRALRGEAGTGHLAAPIAFGRAAAAAHAAAPFDVIEATNWYAPAACLLRLGVPLVTRCSTPACSTGEVGATGTTRDAQAVFDLGAAAALERYQARASAALISNTAHHGIKVASLYGCAPPSAGGGKSGAGGSGAGGKSGHAVIGLSLPPGAARAVPTASHEGPFSLLFVGRPTRRKGFDALVAAAHALGPGYEVRMVGIEPGEHDLPPACVPLGRLDDAALSAELRAAHAVIAPSRYESFGLVYQEAIQAGRPLVACAEDPAARAFVGRAGTGLLAASCDGEGLAAAARALVEVPARYEAALAACEAAARRFTRETLGAETEAVYRSVLQGRNGVSSARSSAGRAVSVAPSDIAP